MKFNVGDIVMLRSGGPHMVVQESYNGGTEEDRDTVVVRYYNQITGLLIKETLLSAIMTGASDKPQLPSDVSRFRSIGVNDAPSW